MLFAIQSISMNPIVLIVLLAVVAFAVGVLLFKLDTRRENMRRDAIELSRLAGDAGLPITAGLLEDVGVGDYSGVFQHVKELVRTLRDENQRKAALRHFLEVQLEKYMADEGKRKELFAYMQNKGYAVVKAEEVE